MTTTYPLFNFRTGAVDELSRGATIKAADYIPQDPIAQNLFQIRYLTEPLTDAIAAVLRACAARQPDGVGLIDYGAVLSEWLSIPTHPEQVAGVICQHCGGFCPIEQAPDDAPVEIVYQPEALYPAADQVGPVAED